MGGDGRESPSCRQVQHRGREGKLPVDLARSIYPGYRSWRGFRGVDGLPSRDGLKIGLQEPAG